MQRARDQPGRRGGALRRPVPSPPPAWGLEGDRVLKGWSMPICDRCKVTLKADGTCPQCGVSHAGEPCPACGCRGYHAENCADPGDPWREAGPAHQGRSQ